MPPPDPLAGRVELVALDGAVAERERPAAHVDPAAQGQRGPFGVIVGEQAVLDGERAARGDAAADRARAVDVVRTDRAVADREVAASEGGDTAAPRGEVVVARGVVDAAGGVPLDRDMVERRVGAVQADAAAAGPADAGAAVAGDGGSAEGEAAVDREDAAAEAAHSHRAGWSGNGVVLDGPAGDGGGAADQRHAAAAELAPIHEVDAVAPDGHVGQRHAWCSRPAARRHSRSGRAGKDCSSERFRR